MNVTGKLVGHTARGGLVFLRAITESGIRNITFDLRNVTSIDSIGIAILNHICGQSERLNVSFQPPIRDSYADELVSISRREGRRFIDIGNLA